MSIPSNFRTVEQQILNCTVGGTPVTATFTVKPPAGIGADQCFVWNDGANSAQILTGPNTTVATPVVDANANGTGQLKLGSKVGVLLLLNGDTAIGAVTESGNTTKIYAHRGHGQ
jgi:hypothetical protein